MTREELVNMVQDAQAVGMTDGQILAAGEDVGVDEATVIAVLLRLEEDVLAEDEECQHLHVSTACDGETHFKYCLDCRKELGSEVCDHAGTWCEVSNG